MLRALGDPLSLLVLLPAFLVCITLAGWVSSLVASRQGQPALRQEGRTRPDVRRHTDPFGAIAGLIAGFGWARPVEPRRGTAAATALAVLSGPLVVLALGLGLVAAFGATSGLTVSGDASFALQQGSALPFGQAALLLSGLMATYVGALSLVPLPPLPGGQVLFAAAPRTPGWTRAAQQLVERNIGTAVLLVLLVLPLGGPQALLPTLMDTVLGPLLQVVSGG